MSGSGDDARPVDSAGPRAESGVGAGSGEPDERRDLLALCTEERRLGRADPESRRVHLQVDGPDLFIAAVGAYNVVIDLTARRIQHGCRDFFGQARERKLCKHVAALLLAIDPVPATEVLRGLTDPDADWHLEVIATRVFGS